MQSSSATNVRLVSRSTCIAFFEEYLTYRTEKLWTSYARTSGYAQERKDKCNDFIQRIKHAITVADREGIIRDLGKEARIAQSHKYQQSTKENTHLLNSFALIIASFFSKESSLFAKTCHAVRTLMIADILSVEEDASLHRQEIEKIRDLLKEKEEMIRVKTHIINTTALQKERDELYFNLLDMHDEDTLHHAAQRKEILFPLDLLPSYNLAQIKLPKDIHLKINPNIPLVYNIHYSMIFLENDIKGMPERAQHFNEAFKKISSANEEPTTTLNCFYFLSLSLDSQILPPSVNENKEENILAQPSTQTKNEKSNTENADSFKIFSSTNKDPEEKIETKKEKKEKKEKKTKTLSSV